jgi:hypothetical protein
LLSSILTLFVVVTLIRRMVDVASVVSYGGGVQSTALVVLAMRESLGD